MSETWKSFHARRGIARKRKRSRSHEFHEVDARIVLPPFWFFFFVSHNATWYLAMRHKIAGWKEQRS
jgi:hypothetical protein